MNAGSRLRPGHPQLRQVEHRRSQDDSPEAVLLCLGPDIRCLNRERPFSEELVLMEQVFELLLEGFRRQLLRDGRVGLLPPQPGVAPSIAGSPAPAAEQAPGPAGSPPLSGPAAPATAQDQAIAALLQAGMDWVQVDGQAAALCFPSPPQAPSLNSSLPVESAEGSGCGDRLPRAGAEAHPCRPSGDRWL